MAKQISFIPTDTPISGVTTNPINLGLVNFGADFVSKDNSSNGEALITNVRMPVGLPENFRFASSRVEDVYKSSTIEPSYRSQSKAGVKVLVQNTDVLKETDTTDATYEVFLPFGMTITVTVPARETVTAVVVEQYVRRGLAGLYETGDNGETRLGALLRGSLTPSDI